MKEIGAGELSDRELEILRLVATGASNKEIAQKLFISPNTVKVHLRNIFEKIGVVSRTEAALFAFKNGLSSTTLENTGEVSGESNLTFNTPQIIADDNKLLSATRSISKSGKFLIIALVVLLIMLGAEVIYLAYLKPGNQSTQQPSTGLSQNESRWKELAIMPTARFGLAVAVYDNHIFAIGGETALGITGAVERYDPETNTWTILGRMPIPLADIQAAVISGKIYIPGGRTLSGSLINELEIYDPIQGLWTKGAPVPVKLSGYALATFEGKIYLFGGWDGQKFTDTALMYDPSTDLWQRLSPIPYTIGLASSVVSGRRIYIIGGYDGNKASNEILVFEPDLINGSDNPWLDRIPMESGRYGLGVTSVADSLYIIGGISDDRTSRVVQALMYIPMSNEWQLIEPVPDNMNKYMAVVSLGSSIYCIGGVHNEKPSSTTLAYKAIYTLNIPFISNEK